MSWSVSTTARKQLVKQSVYHAASYGSMPFDHLVAVFAAIDRVNTENVSLNAYGHIDADSGCGNINITVNPA